MIAIIPCTPIHQPSFETLNRDWIERLFTMEPMDYQVLQNPEKFIIEEGVRCSWRWRCMTMRLHHPGVYEMTKMAVEEKFRCRYIGQALAETAIARAVKSKGEKVILASTTKLPVALALCKKPGFADAVLSGPYQRSDVQMELLLNL